MNTDETTTPDAATVPSGAPRRIVSRRSMLGGLGLGSLSTMVLPVLGTAAPAAAATRKPHPAKVRDTNGNYAPVTPYLTQASCQLTEDYFLTDEVLVDLAGGGEVLPFTTQDGDTAAIIVTGSGSSRAVSYLARDNWTVCGWTLNTINTGLSTIVDAAVYGSKGNAPQLLVAGTTGSGSTAQSWVQYMTLDGDTWTKAEAPMAVSNNTKAIESGVGPAGQFFYSWSLDVEPVGIQYKSVLRVTRYYLEGAEMVRSGVLIAEYSSVNFQIDDLYMRYDPAGKDGWIVFRYEGAFMRGLQIAPNGYQVPPLEGIADNWLNTPNLEALVGIYGSGPDVVWQDTSGAIHISTDDGKSTTTIGQATGSDPTSVSAWVSDDGLYTFAFCQDGVINTVTEYVITTPVHMSIFTPPIPMLTGVTKVFGVDTDPSASTLFAVDLDEGLSVMSYGPSGWTDRVVHQTSLKTNEVTCWQCQVTVTDANGIGVSGATVQVTTDRPVAVWQEDATASSSTTLQPGTPVTFTADINGKLILALPTNEIDSAQLVMQALDGSGNPSGSPLNVGPDSDVQAFMAGTGSLDSVGSSLSGGAMTGAQNLTYDSTSQTYQSSGALFTRIADLAKDPTQQAAAAEACATAIMHVANLPSAVPAAATDIRSACLDMTGSVPTFATSTQANFFTLSTTADTSWWVKAANDAASFYQGLRHGAIQFGKMVTSWADDAKQWTINMLITIGDGMEHAVNFVVKTAKEAIHAISGFFQALGADLEKAWNWLKNLICGIIAEAEKGAKVMEAWITQLGSSTGPLMTALDSAEGVVNGWFTSLETKVDGYITDMVTAVGQKTFGSSAPPPQSTSNTGSNIGDINLKDLGKAVSVLQKCSPMYWIHKLEKHLPRNPSNGGPSIDIDFSAAAADLLTALQDAVDLLEAVEDTFIDAFKAMFASQNSLHTTPLAKIYQILQATESDDKMVVHYLLGVLDMIADAVFDLAKAAVAAISSFFSYEFQMVPLIGGLLDKCGVDTKVSIQHLFCLVAAFPTAVIYRAIGYKGDMFPPQTDDEEAAHAWAKDLQAAAKKKGHPLGDSSFADPWGVALNVPSIPVQLAWMATDVAVDAGTSNKLTTIVGTAAPLLMNIFGWPSKPYKGGNTGYPFRGGVDKTSTDWGLIPGIIINEFAPPMSNMVGLALSSRDAWKSTSDKFNDWVSPVLSTLSGVIGCVLGGTWAGVNQSDLGIEEAVIGNVSYLTGMLGLPPLKDNPYAKIGKTIADGVGDFSTAILYMYAFSAAADG